MAALQAPSRIEVGAQLQARPRMRAVRRQPLMCGVFIAYTLLSTALMAVHAVGFTAEHLMLIGLVLFCLFAPARPFVWDWLPFLGVGVMFADLSTLTAKGLGSAHSLDPILAERALLGGNIAAVWLQEHLLPLAMWFDAPMGVIYLSFFLAPVTFGVWLWRRHRDHFSRFVAAYLCMMAIAFLVAVVYPETPPWLAARAGLLPPVNRITVSLLDHLGAVGRLYSGADPAPYSAMPALHVAVPTLIAATGIGIRGWRLERAWPWVLYPVTMAFATIYLGEHYVLDGVAGMALGAVCFGVVQWVVRQRRVDRAARAGAAGVAAGG